ncbi:MAG: hypothetical protein NTX49_01640 [Chlamydiae bacterium]|nr:hypothetical protein [Chlamydiota bacterium]
MRNFLKYFSFPMVLIIGSLSFAGYMAWKEYKINETLVDAALQGNPYAIKILAKYEKPWKLDQRVVLEAINGNQYALQVIEIES